MRNLSLAMGVAILLTGCGGGGTDGSGSPSFSVPQTAFQINAAVTSIFTATHHFTDTYTDPSNGDVYIVNYDYAPGGDASFEGQAAKTTNTTISITKNSAELVTASEVEYFQLGPYKSLGATLNSGEYITVDNQVALPDTAKVGDSGSLDTSITYTNSTKISISDTTTETWFLEADTATTAFLCFSGTTTSPSASPSSAAECYKIDASGNIIGNKLTLTVGGKTITFSQ